MADVLVAETGDEIGSADLELVDLVLRARKGEQEAISALVDRVQRRVFRFCFHLCGEASQAEDICQEALVKALKQLSKLEDPSKFNSWILRIAKNHFLDEVRRPGRTREVLETESDSGAPKEFEASSQVPQDASLAVRQALGQLKPDDQLLLVLVDVEECSYAEASEIIGISENALRSRLHRARAAFLKIFNSE